MPKEEVQRAFDLVEEWNSFVESLIEARKAWDKCSNFIRNARPRLEVFPIAMQRFASLSLASGKFDVGATQLIEYSRRNGGLEVLKIPVTKTTEKGDK